MFGEDGFIWIGGRLHRAEETYGAKHPVILPANDPATILLICEMHKSNAHQGELCVLSENYWIVSGRMAVKRIVRRCVKCQRHHGKPQ